MRCFLLIALAALSLGCRRGERGGDPQAPSLRIAVVTDLKGYLEPCGCTSDPLGGIDRLAAQVQELRRGKAPVVVLIAGDTFFDTADLEPARVDQAERNAKTLARILEKLEVAAVLPGRRDRAQPTERLESIRRSTGVPWLAMRGDAEVLRTQAGRLPLAIVGARPSGDLDAIRAAISNVQKQADLTIALVDGSRRDANRVGAIEGVDFVLQGGLDQDEAMPPRQAGGAWVLHASRQGQGLTVADVYLRKKDAPVVDQSEWSRASRIAQLDRRIDALRSKVEAWEKSGDVDAADLQVQRERLRQLDEARRALDASPKSPSDNVLDASFVPLRKKAPRDEQIEALMREHDKAVNDANRVAFAGLKPPPLGPDDVGYVGSEACSGCHQEAYAWWRNHAHGLAYETLQKRNKEFNLDCVGCHVTGYGKPGGATVTHNLNGALADVGCESCHGPGAPHSANPEVGILRDTPESTCVGCHNETHSDLFAYDEYRKTLVVPGHGLPAVDR